MNKYYVYAYLRKSTGQPYYIGKGFGRRAFVKHCWAKTPKDKNQIVFIQENLTELKALSLEKELICKWGRTNNSTGILLNLTDGGEGVSGLIHCGETKIKISKAHKSLNKNIIWKNARLTSIKKVNLEKLGVDFPLQNKEVQLKSNDTLFKNHGVRNPSQIQSVKDKKKKIQKDAGAREIVQLIKDLNGNRRKRKIELGRGWYRKSEAKLQLIVDELFSLHH
jgi:hypothetical protein